MRFHSIVPFREFFEAADEVGILVMAELPAAYSQYFYAHRDYLRNELRNVLLACRNHPSLLSVALGNEFNLHWLEKHEQRREAKLIMSNDGFDLRPTDMVSLGHGAAIDRPTVRHEFGAYYCSLPDVNLAGKFTGGMIPEWLETKKRSLDSTGWTASHSTYLRNSQLLQQLGRKYQIERVRANNAVSSLRSWAHRRLPAGFASRGIDTESNDGVIARKSCCECVIQQFRCYNMFPAYWTRPNHSMAANKTPSVPALDRGLAILEMIARSKSGLTFSQMARSLEFPKSSIHCILVTFERLGYLHRSETTGRYLCGMKLVEIANLALDGTGLREKASPLLRDLSERTGLTVHMAVFEGQEATLVAKAAMVGGQHIATWVGKRIDVHCTSLGKCLLAYVDDAVVDDIIRCRGLLRHNENTIGSGRKLKLELVKTRTLGYAVDDQEEEIGIRCIGAPVFDADGRIAAAVSLSGTVDQIGPDNQAQLVAAVQYTASALSHRLGWTGESVGPLQSIGHG